MSEPEWTFGAASFAGTSKSGKDRTCSDFKMEKLHCTGRKLIIYLIVTVRKQSLGRGTIFLPVCLFTGGSLYDVTSCLAAWSHVPSGGSLSLVTCSFGGLYLGVSVQGVSVWGSLSGGSLSRGFLSGGSLSRRVSSWQRTHHTVRSRRYACYSNAFLFDDIFLSFKNCVRSLWTRLRTCRQRLLLLHKKLEVILCLISNLFQNYLSNNNIY